MDDDDIVCRARLGPVVETPVGSSQLSRSTVWLCLAARKLLNVVLHSDAGVICGAPAFFIPLQPSACF